jgi:hypothetical protein
LLRRILRETGIVAFFVGLALLATRPLVTDLPGQTLAGGDPLVDLWTIDWLFEHFFEPGRIFHGNTFYPSRHAVLFSDLSLGTVVLLLPLKALALDPVPVFNLALLAALAFGGWAFCALTRALTGNLWAGLATGTLAAFSSHQLYHIYHINLLTIGWLALFLLGLHRIVARPSAGAVVLAGVSAALSAQSSGYYAVGVLVLGLAFLIARRRALVERRRLIALAAGGVLALALTAPYLWSYLSLRTDEGLRRPIGMSVQMAFQPGRDLTSHGYLYGALLGHGGERLFPGLVVLALAAAAVLRRAEQSGFYAATALVLLILSLGPYLDLGGLSVPLPYLGLVQVPPFNGMRHPYTFAALATFLAAVLAGLGWSRLRLASRRWAGPLLVALAVAETLAPPPVLQPIPPGVPDAYHEIGRRPPGGVLEIPLFAEEVLVWAARSGLPMVNGQGSAFVPSRTLVLERRITNHWVEKVPDDADESRPTPYLLEHFPGVRYLIVPAGRKPALAPLAEAFDRSRVFGFLLQTADGDRIYELRQ